MGMEITGIEYSCKTNLHKWTRVEEAKRCCNGWTHIMVPVLYGDFYKGKTVLEVRKDLKLWKPYLIKDSDVAEMERIIASSPDWILNHMQ